MKAEGDSLRQVGGGEQTFYTNIYSRREFISLFWLPWEWAAQGF